MTDKRVATDERKARIAVGSQIRRWRTARERTLAQVAAASGVNVGYLSQIENDKASPSLAVILPLVPGGRGTATGAPSGGPITVMPGPGLRSP